MYIYRRIKALQKKLNESIQKNGLSHKRTVQLSREIDDLINEYYNSIEIRVYPTKSVIPYYYNVSYNRLQYLTYENNRFPTVAEWNTYAKENRLLSSESMKYVSKLNWDYLEIKVNREINMKKN